MAQQVDIEAAKNEDHNKLAVSHLKRRLKEVYLGGGEKRIAKHKEKGKMTARELVERYVAISEAQFEATEREEIARVNRLFGLRVAVEEELKRRDGDQRRALLPLLQHRNLQVRLNAATATRAIDPKAARRALDAIAATHWMPYAADARGLLRGLDEGMFRPG